MANHQIMTVDRLVAVEIRHTQSVCRLLTNYKLFNIFRRLKLICYFVTVL